MIFVGRRLQRLLAATLLALVVSPLTAPFAAGHPLDLLGGSATHIQSKKGPDDPIISLAVVVAVLATLVEIAPDVATTFDNRDTRPHTHSRPLRL